MIIAIIVGLSLWLLNSKSTKNPVGTPSVIITPTISPSSLQGSLTSPNPSNSETVKIKVFMIAADDNGQSGKLIGCGDSVVGVIREIPYTQAVLKAAMEQLVSIKDKNYGESGLYNPLYQSSLNLVSATIDSGGKATIKFTGTLQLSGTCEDPRIKAQLEETALQFSTVKSADIWINDKTLNEIMSLKD